MLGTIRVSQNYCPNMQDPCETWVFTDDDYDNRYSNATSGALLLPSINTNIIGMDNPDPNVFYNLYVNDLNRPDQIQFILAILIGAMKNGKHVVICPGNSPSEVYMDALLHIIQQFYGVVIDSNPRPMNMHPAYINQFVSMVNSYGLDSISPEMVNECLYGPQQNGTVSPFAYMRRERTSANIS